VNALLKPLELLYRGINRLRRALYRAGLLRQKRLPRPVISIGNIAAGGTGKTPAVIAVCRELESRGLRAAVLTRGYGRRDPAFQGLCTDIDPDKYGDEPALIKTYTSSDVIVGRNRYHNALQYLKDHSCDAFILDDGFQHLQLARDLDVVIDAPARFHREGRAALRHAGIVIPRRVKTLIPAHLRDRPAFAFAALADNEQFFDSLRQGGVQLIGARGFPDHHRYSAADLETLKRQAGGAPLVTTEKDAIKISDPSVTAVRAEFEIDAAVLEAIAAVVEKREKRKRKRRKGKVLERGEYVAFRLVSRLAGAMSEESAHRWGARLGSVARRALPKRDALALRNLQIAFPEREASALRAILDECWRHFGRETLRYLRMRNLSLEEVTALCTVENGHLLDEAIARGRGAVLITAHWGSWEVAGLAVMAMVPSLQSVARPLDNELLERDLQQLRAKTGAAVVDRRNAARVLLRALSQNAVVALLPDQAVQPREGVLVPFLGRPAWTTPAPAKMALRSNATMVFGFCKPERATYRLEVVESIDLESLPDDERDPIALTTRMNEIISRRIREQPELWLWMHDRWKGT
jgi:lauroyl/myristoyl acyltransferase/tetraacyldisaccharide-1-P 4'-kinase